jgi:phasin family protein
MAATKSLMTSKSVQELMERQADYARASFETYMSEVNAMSDMVAGMTKDAIKPLNERMTAMSTLIQSGAAR